MLERVLVTAVATIVSVSGSAWAQTVTDLQPVTVTATRSEHTVAEAPASVTVITAEEIQRKGATNVLEAVRGTPGITLTGRQVGGRKTITIRGAEDRHTLVLVDGRRINSTDDVVGHSDFQYGWVSMDQIERIEVVRGPMSALYGSEAVGGVVNIITKKAGKTWSGGVTVRGEAVEGAGGESRQESARISGPLGAGFAMALSVDDLRQNDVPLKNSLWESEIEGTVRRNAALDLTFEPAAGHQLFVNLLRGREERWRNTKTSGGVHHGDEYDISRRQKSAGYRGNWGPVRPELRVSRSDTDITNARDSNVAATTPQTLRDDTADGNVAFGIGDSHLITLGGEFREETLENAGLPGGSDSAVHKGAFAQEEFQILDALTLTLGARHDDHEYFGSEISPRAFLVWKATPSLTVKGGYGEAFRAPTLKQISPNYAGATGPHTFLGNANIKPETSRSYEIGFDWRDDGRELAATLFRNEISDLIYSRQIAQVGPRKTFLYDNISRARLDGLELSGRHPLGGGFAVAASYTYMDAANLTTGAGLTGRPEHSMTPRLEWAEGQWFAQMSAEYVGAQHLAGATSANERAPSYTLWSLNGTYELDDNTRLRAGLRNITDVRLADESHLFGYSELGRSVFVSTEVKF